LSRLKKGSIAYRRAVAANKRIRAGKAPFEDMKLPKVGTPTGRVGAGRR